MAIPCLMAPNKTKLCSISSKEAAQDFVTKGDFGGQKVILSKRLLRFSGIDETAKHLNAAAKKHMFPGLAIPKGVVRIFRGCQKVRKKISSIW